MKIRCFAADAALPTDLAGWTRKRVHFVRCDCAQTSRPAARRSIGILYHFWHSKDLIWKAGYRLLGPEVETAWRISEPSATLDPEGNGSQFRNFEVSVCNPAPSVGMGSNVRSHVGWGLWRVCWRRTVVSMDLY